MAYIPPSWEAYERLQRKLSSTDCSVQASSLEEALNVILQPDFLPGAVDETDFLRVAASAARQGRHRVVLLRRAHAATTGFWSVAPNSVDDEEDSRSIASSLDDAVHARKELARLAAMLREPDWELLRGVASGVPYSELAREHACTTAALRSRVCRLREAISGKTALGSHATAPVPAVTL
ncbi:hypothetical protein F6X40_15170 [Paraburkholderia sp. UCT31]|uniref:hypothetical protein n=1 Tax=Paraburkholderia sp. UCT31 TaxID=2615209 RepID=UPI001655F00F|nr:hypothetical protein [Paraburkholderia sp. UCT31]MBC8738135.1 hypothetical protein [Paraburkholderia sp. UCT31]